MSAWIKKLLRTLRFRAEAAALNRYFANAARCWVWGGDAAARLAALAAGKTAAGKQRDSMIIYLRGLAEDLNAIETEADVQGAHQAVRAITEAAVRLRELAEAIAEKDWGLRDVFQAKADLAEVDSDYFRAMCPVDPDVFIRRHPQLFE